MELRSCTHLHYIQAAKGGLLVKTLNSFRGRPALKLKKLTDIYEALGVKNQGLILQSEDEFEGLLLDGNTVQVGRPLMCAAEERVLIKSEPDASEFSCSAGGGDGTNSVMDDAGFGDMTLKQLKERCKVKKRKHSKCVDFSREENVMSSHVKREYCKLIETDEDVSDLMEPLSSWKSKLSKNVKAKSKCLKKRVFAPSQSASSVIESEGIPSHQDFLQSKGDLRTPIDVKMEIPEPDCSDFQNNSSLICDNQSGSCALVSKEVSEIAAECVSEMREQDPQLCVLNEAYFESMDNCNVESVPIVSSSGSDIEKVDDPEVTSDVFSASESKEEEYVTPPIHDDDLIQEPIFLINDHSSDVHNDSQIFPSNHEMQCQIDSDPKVQIPDMTIQNFIRLECIGSDECSPEDGSRDELPSNLETSALRSSVGDCGLNSNCCMVYSADDSPVAEEKESQRSESSLSSNCCLVSSADDSPVAEKESQRSDSRLSSNCCLVSSADDPPVAEEKESHQRSACGDAESNCSLETLQHDASKELTTTVDASFNHCLESDRPPERLFPTRKTISPASQEKLCKALESVQLQDEERYGGKKKLCFGKQIENATKIHNTKVPEQVRRIRFSIKPKHIVMKPKNEKGHSRSKGIPKVPHFSQAVPPIGTECNSIQSCSQSAIAFSERQMHDIECLATKLTDELKTMKEIVEERLWSEAYPGTSLKYNANEVRMAIKNASKVEQSAKKWLSMMARDCSRFCKIMRLSEKASESKVSESSDASESVVNKERKRITFADEAGEKLCHVRIFENDLTTWLGSDGEKQEMLVQ
ncbi:uncharacterized protein LOC107420233 [Ziziphus jujuba]|uniref:Uncharacterized protein LOC107420233 n=3 Tax=Ziziphus jujuba TaxID=326968 RepID=A0A6P3ZWC2_ZIZJJ|nr:uncharacterized protein LOC107420233 [Ziziphus jujuba]XP_024930665.3 uncharacterized protein LOC107420233 [Ziziphus jujuba]